MRFISGLVAGVVLTACSFTLVAQNEKMMHPRIAAAITSLKDAEAYMRAAPHDFGGHKAAAMEASANAIRQLNLALAYRGKMDHK
jgi:hypothetical protein